MGDTSSALRGGYRKSTKLRSVTCSSVGEEVFLKSRMREILMSGSVRGLIAVSLAVAAMSPTRPFDIPILKRAVPNHHQ